MSWADPRPEASAWYWDSAYAPHRDRLIAALEPLAPFHSILEVGCHVGPNRRRIRERFGYEFQYAGVDINARAIEDARKYAADDRHAVFEVCDAMMLHEWPANAFDIVITTGMLVCIEPKDLPHILHTLRRLSCRAVVCQEPTATPPKRIESEGWYHAYPDWVTLVP